MQYEVHGGKTSGERIYPRAPFFIVRMDCISAIGRSTLLIEQKDVPIGDAYRERVKGYVSRLAVL